MEPSWTKQLIEKICGELGYRVETYPQQPSMCRIHFSEDTSTLLFSSTLNVNGAASRIAAVDKSYTKFFLEQEGVSVPAGHIIFSPEWCQAYDLKETKETVMTEYNDDTLFPVMVKPNRGFQGRSVYRARSYAELSKAIDLVMENSHTVLVEECVTGQEYRLLWYKGELRAAYMKTPLRVVGDGASTIGELLEDKRMEQVMRGRGDVITPHMSYITERLHGMGYTLDFILPIDIELLLRDNANLSTGGDVIDYTGRVHQEYIDIAERISKVMDLPFIGIDLITTSSIAEPITNYWVLEVAYTPGLHHFASLGEVQYGQVKALYTELIEDLKHERS